MKKLAGMEYFHTGEVTDGVSSIRLPNIEARMVKLLADRKNKGPVYIGDRRVENPNNDTDCRCGWPIQPGEQTDWIPIENLGLIWMVCEWSGDKLYYMVVK